MSDQLRQTFLKDIRPTGKPVPFPELGDGFFRKPLSAGDMVRILELQNLGDSGTFRAMGTAVIACACTKDGKPIFQPRDLQTFLDCDLKAWERITAAATVIIEESEEAGAEGED